MDLVGHEQVIDRFRRSTRRNRLASTYLFVGRDGIGKRTTALKLAQALLCENDSNDLQACSKCTSCRQVVAQTHPDLILVSKPDDKNFIPVELFIGDREHRRRVGLCHDISLTPFYGRRKVAIIDDADYMNAEGANSLLKTLEEPPPNSILILIGSSEHQQLPTILSRSQVVRFQPLRPDELARVLQSVELPGEIPIARLVPAANGSVRRAIQLDDRELYEFRESLLVQLAAGDPAAGGFAKTLSDFVEGRSKDAATRRSDLRLIADLAIDLYSHTLHAVLGSEELNPDVDLRSFANQLVENINSNAETVAEIVSDCIDRTIAFEAHIAANLALANVVPAWLNDLGAIMRMEKSLA